MDRPVEEAAASQWKMIENREAAHPGASREERAEMLREHREHILHGPKQGKYFSLLVVDSPALVRAPEVWVERIREFVGRRWMWRRCGGRSGRGYIGIGRCVAY